MKTRLLISALLLLPLTVCSQALQAAWFRIHFKDGRDPETLYFEKTRKISLIEPAPTEVKDIDEHVYKVEKIGEKYWTVENLATTKYDYPEGHKLYGKSVPQATGDSIYEPYYCKVDDGCLYNWSAATGMQSTEETGTDTKVQGICPKKFHIPSAQEVNALSYSLGNSGSNALRSSEGWRTENQFITNGDDSYKFDAKPAGYAKGDENKDNGYIASFWTSYSMSDYSGYSYQMHGSGSLALASEDLKLGRSVRCVWDGQTDWDWLYVYEEGVPVSEIKKFLISDIDYIETGDDFQETLRLNGQEYSAHRFKTTFWTMENLRETPGKQLQACGTTENSYLYPATAVNGSDGNSICGEGWRLPTTEDFRQIMELFPTEEIATQLNITPVSASYNGTDIFSYGVESMFWVSDAKRGIKYSSDRSEQIYYLDNIPYIDLYKDTPRVGLISIENALPALPVRCVKDEKEPEFNACHGGDNTTYGVWTKWNPRITFDSNDKTSKRMIVNVGDNTGTTWTPVADGRYDTLRPIK